MTNAEKLAKKWGDFVAAPWSRDDAPAQRVVFAAYPQSDELRVRANLVAFETATTAAGHAWKAVDVEPLFGRWLAGHRYRDRYFARPELLASSRRKFETFLAEETLRLAGDATQDSAAVVALVGVGALFGLASVKELVDAIAPHVEGRTLVLFPGTCENANFKLLDGYDGWGYLATVITV